MGKQVCHMLMAYVTTIMQSGFRVKEVAEKTEGKERLTGNIHQNAVQRHLTGKKYMEKTRSRPARKRKSSETNGRLCLARPVEPVY
jgi:hypothetical protein